MTRLIINPFTSPSFNLALEQYLVENFRSGEIIMLWRNEPSVIIGKNQNAYAEIDLSYVKQNNITVVRRLTGGGAVFHDLGNVNYTFISDYKSETFDNFAVVAAPICEFLVSLGLSASFSGRNDITVNGAKISGTARTVVAGRQLAHGTLLYSADLSKLSKALVPNLKKLEDKAIRSVKSRVANIKELCSLDIEVEDFIKCISRFFLKCNGCELYTLSKDDIAAAKQIENERYKKWEWNFAASPKFSVKSEKKYPFGIVECNLNVSDGKICDIRFFGDFFGNKNINEIEEKLLNTKFEKTDIENVLKNIAVSDYISGMNEKMLTELIISAE